MAYTINDFIANCYRNRHGGSQITFTRSYSHTTSPINTLERSFHFLRIPVTGDSIEVPCNYMNQVMFTLRENMSILNGLSTKEPKEEIFIPLMCLDEDSSPVKTSNAAFRKFFWDMPPAWNLVKKKVGDTYYYGGPGIILYEDFSPLLMLFLELKKSSISDKYIPAKHIVKIDPHIYSNDDILAKYIKSKFIGALFNSHFYSREVRDFFEILATTNLSWDFKVVVEDFSKSFLEPAIPDSSFTNAKVYSLLTEALPAILNSAELKI